MGGIGEFLFGSSDKLKKFDTLSKGQNRFLDSLLQQLQGMSGPQGGYGQAMGLLQGYLNPQSDQYKNFENQYMNQFQSKILPQIAEQYAGAGALSSSGFGQAIGSAGAGLQSQLAALKSQLGLQSAQGIMGQYNNMAQLGLQAQPFGYKQQQGSSGILAPVLGGIGTAFAGPFGGALGTAAGSLFSGAMRR